MPSAAARDPDDTVFPAGTAAARPLRIEGSRAHGPGTADMKGGLLVGLFALARAARGAREGFATVELHSVPDEEARTEAPHLLERLRGATAALVLECGRPSGAIVTARRAAAWVTVRASGRAAHAGELDGDGRSALRALIAEILRVESSVAESFPGVSATATQLRAGSGPNVVRSRRGSTSSRASSSGSKPS